MTIAACYLTPEGVVFGADSTATIEGPNHDPHFFDFGQKIFELGTEATLGAITWGLGQLPSAISYRTMFAELADDLKATPPATVADAAQRWANKFWSQYVHDVGGAYRQQLAAAQSTEEKTELEARLVNTRVGFCIAGVTLPNRRPAAFELEFSAEADAAPTPAKIPMGRAVFKGQPNLIERLLYGIDPELLDEILRSPKWTGTEEDMAKLVERHYHDQPTMLPIRDAIDWIHSCIQSTVKGVKFSPLSRFCGGPIEIAVITSDRPFRWVRHKTLDAAIADDTNTTHPEAL